MRQRLEVASFLLSYIDSCPLFPPKFCDAKLGGAAICIHRCSHCCSSPSKSALSVRQVESPPSRPPDLTQLAFPGHNRQYFSSVCFPNGGRRYLFVTNPNFTGSPVFIYAVFRAWSRLIKRRPGRPGALKAPIGRLSHSKNT